MLAFVLGRRLQRLSMLAAALGVVLTIVSACGCSRAQVQPAATVNSQPAIDTNRLHVVMINGGGTKEQNFQSHLLHVQHLTELLRSAGVAATRMAIFSSDGADPEADLAVRERQRDPAFWLLEGTRLDGPLHNPITFADSKVAGFALQPATSEAIGAWFDTAGKALRPGDTLLLYVTDHGTKNPEDLDNNHIVLWGDDAKLSVRELRAMLEKLDPGVRVLALMSQCFSGSFANLMDVGRQGELPRGNVCGYFASTADRPAYGCYAENLGRNNVGHSFHFLQGLSSTKSFRESHRRVLIHDGTPDVPLRISDEYLLRLLRRAAGIAEQPSPPATASPMATPVATEPAAAATATPDKREREALHRFIDELLREAWNDKAKWEAEIRLLDQIGAAYGTFSPRTFAEIDAQAQVLPDISAQMKNTSRAWRGALGDANEGNVGRFLEAKATWRERLKPTELDALKDAEQRTALRRALLPELMEYTRAQPEAWDKLSRLRRNGRNAAAASYRMEVRLGVILRMQKILSSVAGRHYLATRGTPEQRAVYESLAQCEDLVLPATAKLAAPPLAERKPFPPFEQDVQRAQAALPAWLGIQFREPNPQLLAEHSLQPGAAAVITIYPDAPADIAGLEQGDVILGPPGKPFIDRGQVRVWTMLSPVNEPRQLEVLRGKERMQVTLVPRPFPLKWPELPGPPKLGSAAPPLSITPYRGSEAVATKGPRLLFFWATWCAPCKASVPEILAFEKERKIPVIAITDESRDRLDAFFKGINFDFPAHVAMDEYRKSFVAYGVSGTPTFVWIDEAGNVKDVVTGYSVDKGLSLEGWRWNKEQAERAPQ